MRADRLEQLFVKRRGGGYELLLVLESEAGGRERVRVEVPPTLAGDERAAVSYLANWLSARGARLARKLRVRVERGGELVDAPALRELLLTALASPDEEERWD